MNKHDPYPFQRQVADLLLSGQNVILQAPTGAGKTWAAELPFLEAREQGLDFPRKCIYAVPMRVLANQFAADLKVDGLTTRVQTGEHSDDPMFLADITFATIDQVLSSFLVTPYSLPGRLANLNAGAIASSYLVFDEFHLFDPTSTLPTTVEMLRMLKGVVPFLLMTATFSQNMLNGLADILGATVVPETEQARSAFAELPSQHKTRRYHVAPEALSVTSILDRHKNHTLVICNTVPRAQALYGALRECDALEDTQVRLLHGRFLQADRARIESEVRTAYSREARATGRWITVATQVIEVGLDITCDTMLTELAPANSIIQRAGRCARYVEEQGDVFVFGRSLFRGEEIDLVEKPLPYASLHDECQATLHAFTAVSGQALSFTQEQELLSQVHGPRDKNTIQGLVGSQETFRLQMNAVLRGDRSTSAAQFIRQISSQAVAIHDSPQALLESPFAYETFGLHPGTVKGMVKEWLAVAQQQSLSDSGIYALRDHGDKDESGQSQYEWAPVLRAEDIAGAPLVLVHPRLATYDPDFGFLPDRGGQYVSKICTSVNTEGYQPYGYTLESYQAHTQLVCAEMRQVWPSFAFAAARLAAKNGWPENLLGQLAELAALCHDTGKLTRAWQGWVRKYQQAIGRPIVQGYYVHTDWDPGNATHRAAAMALGARAPHSVEGAIASAPLVAACCGSHIAPAKAAFSAIARHHGPFTCSFRRFSMEPQAVALARQVFSRSSSPALPFDLVGAADPARADDDPSDFWIDPQYDAEFLAYALLARALRLADQTATAAGSGERSQNKERRQ